jgi:hypothetical protein
MFAKLTSATAALAMLLLLVLLALEVEPAAKVLTPAPASLAEQDTAIESQPGESEGRVAVVHDLRVQMASTEQLQHELLAQDRRPRVIRFLTEDLALPVALRAVIPQGEGVQVIQANEHGTLVFPVASRAKSVLILSAQTTPTLLVPSTEQDEVVLRPGARIDFFLHEEYEALPGFTIAPVVSPKDLQRVPWLAAALHTAPPAVTNAQGKTKWSWSRLHDRRSGVERALGFAFVSMTPEAVQRYGESSVWPAWFSRSERKGFREESWELSPQIPLAVEFHDVGRLAAMGSLLTLRLPLGSGFRQARLDENLIAHIEYPNLFLDLGARWELQIDEQVRLCVFEEGYDLGKNGVWFNSRTLPLEAHVRGLGPTLGGELSVTTFPLISEAEFAKWQEANWDQRKLDRRLPLEPLDWVPVEPSGVAKISAGVIGLETCLLLRHDVSGVILDSVFLRGNQAPSLQAPTMGTLRVLGLPLDGFPGAEVFARHDDGEMFALKPSEGGVCVVSLPPGWVKLYLGWRGSKYYLNSARVQAGESTEASVDGVELVDVSIQASGTLSGPLVGLPVEISSCLDTYTTNSHGRIRALVPVRNGKAEVSLTYPGKYPPYKDAVRKTVRPGASEIEFIFQEGRVEFIFPGAWQQPGKSNLTKFAIQDFEHTWMDIKVPDAGSKSLILPVGDYQTYRAPSRCGTNRSTPQPPLLKTAFEVVNGETIQVSLRSE